MSYPFAVHYIYRPSHTPGHYDEALFVGNNLFPYVQWDNARHYSNAVLENMPLVDAWDPDFVNVKPRPSGLVEARVSFKIAQLKKNRKA